MATYKLYCLPKVTYPWGLPSPATLGAIWGGAGGGGFKTSKTCVGSVAPPERDDPSISVFRQNGRCCSDLVPISGGPSGLEEDSVEAAQ